MEEGILNKEQVMPFSFENINIGNTLHLDGTKCLTQTTEKRCAELILERLAKLEGKTVIEKKREKSWAPPPMSFLALGTAALILLTLGAMLPLPVGTYQNPVQNWLGVLAILWFFGFLILIPILSRQRIPLVFDESIHKEQNTKQLQQIDEVERLTLECHNWKNYCDEREKSHRTIHSNLQETLKTVSYTHLTLPTTPYV